MKGVPLVHGSNSGGRHLVVWRIHLVLVVCFNKLGGIKMEIRNLEEFKEFVRKINCERDEFIWRDLVKEFEITIYEPITDLSKLFMSCGFKRIDLWRLDTSKVENMSNMFYDCQSLIDLNLSYLHTESVTDMSSMFESCSNLEVLEIPHFDTRNVKNMSKMFDRCKSLEELDLSSFDTRNVEDMGYMFAWCDCLKKLDLSNFNTENVREMDGMFCYSKSLKELDLSNFNTKNLLIYDGMLEGCNVDVIISERGIELEKLESDKVRILSKGGKGEITSSDKKSSGVDDVFSSSSLF